jgi:hypothetical protein
MNWLLIQLYQWSAPLRVIEYWTEMHSGELDKWQVCGWILQVGGPVFELVMSVQFFIATPLNAGSVVVR